MGVSHCVDGAVLTDGRGILAGVDLRRRAGQDPKSADRLRGAVGTEFPVAHCIFWRADVPDGILNFDFALGGDLYHLAPILRHQ